MRIDRPLLLLALLVFLQTAFTLDSRDYWAFDEPRHADALRHLLEEGHAFSLHVNGVPYPDKPPLYFWMVAGAARLLGTDGPPAFFLVSALGGLALLLATRALARAALPDAPRLVTLGAPAMVLTAVLTQVLLRTTRMDLMFAAGIVLAQALLWRGLRTGRPSGWIVLGLAVAGATSLVKGPYAIALPLAALVGFLLWTGDLRRLVRADVLGGLAIAGALVAAWMLGIVLTEGADYLRTTLRDQVVARTIRPHKHSQPFWFHLAVLPAAFFPWTAFLATVPWHRVLAPSVWRQRWRARKAAPPSGRTWLAACLGMGLLVLSVATSKLFIYGMPLLAPLAVLAADHATRLDAAALARLRRGLGTLLVAFGAAIVLLPRWVPFDEVRFDPVDLAPGVLLILGGAATLATRRAGFAVAFVALFVAQVGLARLVVPRFDVVMSPRAQADALARFQDAGYAPLVFKVYPGTYGYYARRVVPETREALALRRHLEDHPRAVVATSRRNYDRLGLLQEGLEIVQAQRIEGQPHVLLRQEAQDEDAP